MKPIAFLLLTVLITTAFFTPSFSQSADDQQCMFRKSLHYTAGGMGYWYDKIRGGLETITGIPYDELACKNCHISNCDVCHKSEADGKAIYSKDAAKNQDMCLKCHAREASIMKIDKKNNTPDVHFAAGMQCMDCHTAGEMHGD